jgi:hypothetical protein
MKNGVMGGFGTIDGFCLIFAFIGGCCLRLDDLDSFYAVCKEACLPEKQAEQSRLYHEVLSHDFETAQQALI